eukprot:6487063-Amphidinium_carterae.1
MPLSEDLFKAPAFLAPPNFPYLARLPATIQASGERVEFNNTSVWSFHTREAPPVKPGESQHPWPAWST